MGSAFGRPGGSGPVSDKAVIQAQSREAPLIGCTNDSLTKRQPAAA